MRIGTAVARSVAGLICGGWMVPAAFAGSGTGDGYRLTDGDYAAYNTINEEFSRSPEWHRLQCDNLSTGESAWRGEEARLIHVRIARGQQAADEELGERLTAAINVLAHRLDARPALRSIVEHQGLSAHQYAEFSFNYLLTRYALESPSGIGRLCDARQWGGTTGLANCQFVVRHAGEAYPVPAELHAGGCP